MNSQLHNKNKPSAVATLLRESVDKPSAFGSFIMEAHEEIWKDVIGFEGLYQVSSIGRVKSLPKITKWNCHRGEFILKPNYSRNYFNVCLYSNGQQRRITIHRLMAIAFIPNPENKPEVNHKDGIKTNNIINPHDLYGEGTNLEWSTRGENAFHAYKNGLMSPPIICGQDSRNSKLSNKDIYEIRSLGSRITAQEIANKFGVCKGSIHGILQGKSWKHLL